MMLRHTRALAARVRDDERGMTLVELLIGMVMGMVILLAAFFAMESANRLSARTASRIDATDRGRNGMEVISRAIRAQQCFGSTRPMLWASDTGLEFYASIAPEATTTMQPIERHHIEWIQQPTTPDISNGGKPVGDIVEKIWRSTTNPATGVVTWPANPSATHTLAEDVQQAPDRDDATKLAPIFRYYEYGATTGSGRIDYTAPVPMIATAPTAAAGPNPKGLPSAATADLTGIVLIDISYAASPRRQKSSKSANVNLYNSVSVRIADPTNPAGSPQCL